MDVRIYMTVASRDRISDRTKISCFFSLGQEKLAMNVIFINIKNQDKSQ